MGITVKNISNANITIIANDLKFRRELAPGRAIQMTNEVFDELTFDNGFQNLISAGYIKVSGVEDNGIINAPEVEVVDIIELEKIMKERNITRFAQIVPTALPATKTAIVELAVKYDVTDRAFSALIQKYCGVDILKAITLDHQATEPLPASQSKE